MQLLTYLYTSYSSLHDVTAANRKNGSYLIIRTTGFHIRQMIALITEKGSADHCANHLETALQQTLRSWLIQVLSDSIFINSAAIEVIIWSLEIQCSPSTK